MNYISISILLNLNLAIVLRMIQQTSPFVINTTKHINLNVPKIMLKYNKIRVVFLIHLILLSVALSTVFEEVIPMSLYILYYGCIIFWWEYFYQCQFHKAVYVAVLSLAIIILFVSRSGIWLLNVPWSVYICFLSFYLKYNN